MSAVEISRQTGIREPELEQPARRERPLRSRAPEHGWQLDVLTALQGHGRREGDALAAYQRYALASDDDGIRYLAGLIMEDEERHHRMIGEIVNRVRSSLEEVDLEPRVPAIGAENDPGFAARTDELLALERGDLHELRHLKKVLRRDTGSSLLPLLVDVMIHDTSKHIAILDFIKGHTR
jgi:hypothetical protein